MSLTGSEWLLWGGIGIMVLSVFGGTICLVLFMISGKSLKKKLEQDYGKLQD